MNKIYRGKNGHFATKAEKLAMIAAETATVAATAPAPIEEVIVYKGFSKRADDTIHCRGHEFEIGTKFTITDVGMTVTGEVGKDGVEPNRWTSIQQTQRPIKYDTKLVQS